MCESGLIAVRVVALFGCFDIREAGDHVAWALFAFKLNKTSTARDELPTMIGNGDGRASGVLFVGFFVRDGDMCNPVSLGHSGISLSKSDVIGI